jgi:hypothetical protein
VCALGQNCAALPIFDEGHGKEDNMPMDQRCILLNELEGLQARRRDAVDAYTSTGNQVCWREVRDASQAVADKLRELEEMHDKDNSDYAPAS